MSSDSQKHEKAFPLSHQELLAAGKDLLSGQECIDSREVTVTRSPFTFYNGLARAVDLSYTTILPSSGDPDVNQFRKADTSSSTGRFAVVQNPDTSENPDAFSAKKYLFRSSPMLHATSSQHNTALGAYPIPRDSQPISQILDTDPYSPRYMKKLDDVSAELAKRLSYLLSRDVTREQLALYGEGNPDELVRMLLIPGKFNVGQSNVKKI